MRKAEVHETPTLFTIVHRAAEAADPEGVEEGASELLRRIEDRDDLLVLAARAEFDGKPPERVASRLAAQGPEV